MFAQVVLLFANKTPEDVLLKEKFDQVASTHASFSVHYLLSRPGQEEPTWFTSGRVSANFIGRHCPAPSDDHLIFVRF